MSSIPGSIRFRSTADEVLVVTEVVMRRSGHDRREWVPALVVAGFCLLVALQAVLAASGAEVVIGCLVAAPVSAVVVRRFRAARFRAAILRQAEVAGILGERTVTLADDGIHATTAWGESLVRWDSVEVVRGERHVLVLARGAAKQAASGIAVPRDALGDGAAVDAFVAELERRRAS